MVVIVIVGAVVIRAIGWRGVESERFLRARRGGARVFVTLRWIFVALKRGSGTALPQSHYILHGKD